MDILISLITKSAIYAIFILSMNNVILGKTGYWAVGHIAFFALGALSTGIFTNLLGFNHGILIYLTFIIGITISVFFSLVPAISLKRLRGDFFIFISIALAEIIRVIIESIAGPSGFSNIPRPMGLTSDFSFMIFSLAILSIAIVYVYWLSKHPLNNLNVLTRTHEHSAMVFGIYIYRLRIKMFLIGGILASIAGSLFAFYSTGTDPQRFNLSEAVMLFALTILGGVDSIRGSILSAVLYVFTIFTLETIFRGPLGIYAPKISSLIFGIILIIVINFMPQGIMGKRSVSI